jgi:hypothetical protein
LPSPVRRLPIARSLGRPAELFCSDFAGIFPVFGAQPAIGAAPRKFLFESQIVIRRSRLCRRAARLRTMAHFLHANGRLVKFWGEMVWQEQKALTGRQLMDMASQGVRNVASFSTVAEYRK